METTILEKATTTISMRAWGGTETLPPRSTAGAGAGGEQLAGAGAGTVAGTAGAGVGSGNYHLIDKF